MLQLNVQLKTFSDRADTLILQSIDKHQVLYMDLKHYLSKMKLILASKKLCSLALMLLFQILNIIQID